MDVAKTSPRTRTVETLAQILEERRVVHIRGTPTSGKTTLGRLLYRHYQERNLPVVTFYAWRTDEPGSFEKRIRDKGIEDYPVFEDKGFVFDGEYLLILDEGQMTYSDQSLWLGLIKSQSGQSSGPRICILAAYGSPGGGPDDNYSAASSLAFFGPPQRVSITKSRVPRSPDVALFYTPEEFKDVIARFSQMETPKLRLSQKAQTRIFELTNGHPGAVTATLKMLLEVYRNQLKRQLATLDENHIDSALNDQDAMQRLWDSPFSRSLPREDSETAVHALRRALAQRSIIRDLSDEGIKECYEKGWLHSEPVDITCSTVVCVFPTQLHAMFVERTFNKFTAPFPRDKYPRIEELALAIIRKFSPCKLSTRTQTRLGPGAIVRPPEAAYQDEFYYASLLVLGYAIDLNTQWSHSGCGRIDFWFSSMGWGIELLRDGDRLDEHCKRFATGGVYGPWIKDGLITDWLIIDCRTTRPRPYSPEAKLWRAVFDNSFSSVEILDGHNAVLHRIVLRSKS